MFQALKKSGKRPVIIQKEVPGFIAIRLEGAIAREALSMVQGASLVPKTLTLC